VLGTKPLLGGCLAFYKPGKELELRTEDEGLKPTGGTAKAPAPRKVGSTTAAKPATPTAG
jgi:hypothetical protein